MNFTSFDFWWWPFVFIFLAGVLPNAIWRWAGVVLVGNIDEGSQWLVFVRCIATALVAAKVFGIILIAAGIVQTVSSFWSPKWSGLFLHLMRLFLP